MLVRITSKRQVTLPARVLDALGVGPGDLLELEEGPGGFVLRPWRLDPSLLAPLRDKVRPGAPPFDIETFRSGPMTHRYGIDASIANDYDRAGLEVLTLDAHMAALPNARRI